MSQPLPITVIIPTLNCGRTIQRHVDSLNQWINTVSEVVVVDSESADGTLEYLRENLSHSNIRWLSRPKGLYASWNAAIEASTSEYLYMATVGDVIDQDGINRLLAGINEVGADIILSPPRLLDKNGKILAIPDWPIHYLINHTASGAAFLLTEKEAFVMANAFGIHGLLGSSASNLYRAEILKKYPFPTEYGHAGDTAWGCRNVLKVKVAILPCLCASFIHNREGGVADELDSADFSVNFLELTAQAITEYEEMDGADARTYRFLLECLLSTRKSMRDQIRRSLQIQETSDQRMSYIQDLQKDGEKRLQVIREQGDEIQRLQREIDLLRNPNIPNNTLMGKIHSLLHGKR